MRKCKSEQDKNADLSFNGMPIPRDEIVVGYRLNDGELVTYPK